MALPPIVALEIGTSRICALVGEVREDGHLMVTGFGEVKSIGIRKGEVIDFDHALTSVRRALREAEEQANIDIHRVHLVISGAQVQCKVNRGTVHVLGEDREITEKDMKAVAELARKVNLTEDRDVLHSIAQRYYVDGHEGVINPVGMEGFQLSLDMLVVHANCSLLRNVIKVVQTAPVEVADVAFAGLCSSLAVLTPEQKAGGVALLDLGGGTTNVLVYADQCVALAHSLALGGDHVTNDIAVGLKIPSLQAERLKKEYGNALVDSGGKYPSRELPPEGGFPGRTIREADLHTIIHARMDETFHLVREIIEAQGLQNRLGAGLVLTGRGARLKRVQELAERVFNLPCALGAPREISGVTAVTSGGDYAAPIGILRYAARAEQADPASGGRIKDWIRQVLGLGGV